jgi:hypothetical protein
MRAVAIVLAALVTAGCVAAREPTGPAPLELEVLALADSMERIHPDLYHAVPRATFRSQAQRLAVRAAALSREELVVALMRLAALPGERDGHTGIFALDPTHSRPLHAYPLRLYWFPDGPYVVASAPQYRELVGARLTAIAGTPVAQVVERVRPLVPRDNEWSLRARLPAYAVGAEVLRGLGLTRGGAVRFEVAGGHSAVLHPVPVAEWSALLGYESQLARPTGAQPLWLSDLGNTQAFRTIDRGRAVYLAYRQTNEPTGATADRLARLAVKPGIRRVIVDLRLNGGGDNRTYGPLLDVLRTPAVGRKTIVLIGRSTFSAATNFVTEVDSDTRARLLGEPSGGSPNLWGDAELVELPQVGLTVRVAALYWEFADPGDKRLAVVPDVRVPLSAADFFAGRDPVLARALLLP